MTAFSLMPELLRYILNEIFFISVLFQLSLCLYGWVSHSGVRRLVIDAVVLAVSVFSCAAIMAANRGGPALNIPWLAVPLLACVIIVNAVAGLIRARISSRSTLSPASIKEALDNLNTGILFCDADGRAILINYAMGELSASLTGSYPGTLSALSEALTLAEALPESPELFRLPDGSVRRIRTVTLSDAELGGFTQTTAENVTELYDANMKLKEENAELMRAIGDMKRMFDMVGERVREQETLDIKVRVHNDIGKSLIALSGLISGGSEAPEDELRALHRAVSLFASSPPPKPGTLAEAVHEADELRVTLEINGPVPSSAEDESLIAAAAGECVTNCIRHARGSRVTVDISETESCCTAVFTNDGEAPSSPIVEGGGLGNLRRSVEDSGGEMHLGYYPQFTLTLKLYRGRHHP